jgi:hypothetical protein
MLCKPFPFSRNFVAGFTVHIMHVSSLADKSQGVILFICPYSCACVCVCICVGMYVRIRIRLYAYLCLNYPFLLLGCQLKRSVNSVSSMVQSISSTDRQPGEPC